MNFPDNAQTLAIVCNQWGDTGKGKLVDYFADSADVIARGGGGANAGHTISIKDEKHVFHLIPSSILHTKKTHIIGNFVVLDPGILISELDILAEKGIPYENLRISHNAKLVLPSHLVVDRARDSGPNNIGTTGRGIGPAYEDHCKRIGLKVNDLLNPGVFKEKFLRNLEDKVRILKGYDPELIKSIMHHEHLGKGLFYDSARIFNADEIIDCYLDYGKKLSSMITDTDQLVRDALNAGKRILLEGAQGFLLSVDYGTYPYVTAYDCSVYGLAKGVGLSPKDIEFTLGIVKAFYMTRVGNGCFPTEMGGERSASWCATKGICKDFENRKFTSRKLEVKSKQIWKMDEFDLGIAVRQIGDEYGSTTGRPRRTGWLDLPLLRYAVEVNGIEMALTKLDVLSECPIIKICYAYRYEGPDCRVGSTVLYKGYIFSTAIPYNEVLRHCRPVYREFQGWMSDISNIRSYEDLPARLKEIVSYIEREVGVTVRLLSVGPDREDTIFK